LWLSVQHSYPETNAVDLAVAAVRSAAAADQAAWVQAHRDWWHAYYPQSFVSTGDGYWDSFYWIQQYKMACATRDNGWIMDNQGPWLQPTAWNATWWNLNIQLSHSGGFKANRREMVSALSHRLDINRAALARSVAEEYRDDSYAIGRSISGFDLLGHSGEPGGRSGVTDANLSKECGNLLWGLHTVDLEYRYWLDTDLRDDVLYPLLTRAVNYYRHFLEEESDGLYHLPSTHSPELTNVEDCTYDIDLLHWGVGRLLELADERGYSSVEEPMIPVWTDLQAKLVPAHTNETGRMIGRDTPLNTGHRHWSHLLAVYPLRTLTPEIPADRELIQTSLDRWHSFGSGIAGYAFTGASCMSSMLGNGDDALNYLNTLKGYLKANTMYSEIGLPVIETPIHGASAIQEMMLQSWGGRLRVFPGLATSWTDAQFKNLRGEGGFLTTARREGGATQWVLVEAELGGTVDVEPQLIDAEWTTSSGVAVSNLGAGVYRIETAPGDWVLFWPNGEAQPAATVEPVERRGDNYRFGLTSGYVEIDTAPPSPDPMSWALVPAAYDATTVLMEAATANDVSAPVEYYFENTSNGDNSGWTTETRWLNAGLTSGQSYAFRVRARDTAGNVGDWSAEAAAVPADDLVAPNPDPLTWVSAPAALTGRAIGMTASTASDPTGVEYYFTCTSGAGNDSGWQDSPTYIDAGLEPNTTYAYTVMARDRSANANRTGPSSEISATTLSEAGVLFSDTFDRADSTDLNASSDGQAGSLAPLNYTARTFNVVDLDIYNNSLRINGPATSGSYGGLVYINDHNFTGTGTGGFEISVDIAAYSTAGSGRRMSVGVGQSLAELAAQVGVDASEHVADLLVAYRNTTDSLEIYKNGVLDETETVIGGLPDAPTTMRIEYILSDYNAGSTVLYNVYFDDEETPFTSGTFVWSGTNENYISLSSNLSYDSLFDNLEIKGEEATGSDETAPAPDPMTWATPPTAESSSSITMTATTATDESGVEYNFTCTAGGGHDSGWQGSPTYTDTGLSAETAYSYTVMARDKSANQNTTAASAALSATTPKAPDVDLSVIYSETFDGDGASGLDGVAPTIGDNDWDAKSDFINNDGTINGGGANGAWAGAALLPFSPETNQVYVLSVDMLHTGNDPAALKYLALGFTQNGINDAVADTSNRFPNLNGSAWFMYGHGGVITTYAGLGDANEIANTGTYVGETFVNLTVRIDTTGDGTSFTADFLIDGVSIVGGPQPVATSLDDINYVGIGSYGTRTSASPVGSIVDNFKLSIEVESEGPAEIGEIGMTVSGSALGFSWHGEAGKTYGLETTDDLVAGDWQTVTNVTGTNGLVSLTASVDNTNAFYRVILGD
uniref:glycosyl hydrolase family 95 catalytic domain-containing protein n=1 Tax=Pontiella sp. TaxID=2837462 RepID=UPI0035661949